MAIVADITSARDLVYAVLDAAWKAQSSPPLMIYDDQELAAPGQGPYAEARITHITGAQSSMGEPGHKRWSSEARLIVDIYNDVGDGRAAADAQARVVQNAFRGKSTSASPVWFRGVRVSEQPREGSRSCTRVVVDLQYDEQV